MGFREKLLDLKRRLSDRKMYSIVIAVIGIVGIWGFYQYKQASELRQELDNQYNRAFSDLNGYVRNVEVLLIKSMITSSPAKTALTLQEAWRQANLAQTNLGQLPISTQVLSSTSKFLTQVGDLSYSLNNQNLQGKPLTEEQYKTIENLHGYSVSLGKSLNSLQGQIYAGRIKWGELATKGTPLFKKASKELPAKQFENIDKTFQNYPTLIYDGPFSDHMVTAEPRGVSGDNINSEQAKKKVAAFFGQDKIKAISDVSRNDTGPIKTFGYKVTFKGRPDDQAASIDVTQKGGHVFWMLLNRQSTSAKLNIDQAKEEGRAFLKNHGFTNMVDTYYLKEDNTATINFAYKQDGVVIYPDLIKLKIALDNGEVLGFESKGYLSAHTARKISKPKMTEQQARALISKKMNILSSGLAIIPTDYKSEIFTYEFKGKLNNTDFLVYINADNGREENILMIINTPNGVLTM